MTTSVSAKPTSQNGPQLSKIDPPNSRAATDKENKITHVALSAMEVGAETITTATYSKIKLDFVKQEKKEFYFSINYNGYQTPIAYDKLEQLSCQASAHLNSIFENIQAEIKERENQGRNPKTLKEKFYSLFNDKLSELKLQKQALENMTDFEFVKKENTPQLRIKYIDPSSGNKETLFISLKNLQTQKQAAIYMHIQDIEAEKNNLLSEQARISDPNNDSVKNQWLKITSDGKRLQFLTQNWEILKEAHNYQVDIEGDDISISLNVELDKKTYYPYLLKNSQLVPHVEGEELTLNNFYGSVYEIFTETAKKNKKFAEESGYTYSQKIHNPEIPLPGSSNEINQLMQRQQLIEMLQNLRK